MHMTKRTDERASALQRSTVAAWYLAACFVICLLGATWLAAKLGLIDFGGDYRSETSRQVARAAAQRAAAQQAQARLTAREEARNIAADANRLIKAPGPTPTPEPESGASAASIAGPANAPLAAPQQPAPAAIKTAQQ